MQVAETETGPRIIRADLKAIERNRGGKSYWVARGFVPIRDPETGRVTAERRERSLAGDTATARRAEIDALNQAFEAEAAHAVAPITFAKALQNYVETDGSVPIYAERILKAIGLKRCREITDSDLTQLRRDLFKPDAAPSYVNRHLYTPVIAVLAQALKQDAPKLTRPRGHKERADGTEIRIPPPEWYGAVTRHLGPGDAALVYFLVAHGRRLADAQRRRPAQFDPVAGTLTVGKTKNGEPLLVNIVTAVADMIRALPRDGQYLFGDGNPSRFRARVAEACAKAGAEYYTPHEFGRHSFATRMLRGGYSLQYVKDAGGWKSIEIVSRLYGHLERKEWQAGVERVAADLFPLERGAIVGQALNATIQNPVKLITNSTD